MARENTRRKVYAAALALITEGRMRALTMEGIASRAAVSKQTLYRTWASTGEILFDALRSRSADASGRIVIPHTDQLSADLIALARGMIAELTDLQQSRLLRTITAELQFDDALAAQYREYLLNPQMEAIAQRFRQAGIAEPEDAAELFVGPILHRWLLRSRPFDDAWVAAHVNRVLHGLTHHGSNRTLGG